MAEFAETERGRVLEEIRSLAPHEIPCECPAKGIAELDQHTPECPRGAVGVMLDAIEKRDRGSQPALVPNEWSYVEKPSEKVEMKIEHDRMQEDEPMVVTVEVRNADGDPGAGGFDYNALACLTPTQAREAAVALVVCAFLAEKEDREVPVR